MARRYHQGIFTPTNPGKYVGDVTNIAYRSSWEKKFMIWADRNPNVLRWASEELVIPYLSPVDNRMHRYFVDFVIEVKTRTGEVKKYAVEIKPEVQTLPPKQRTKKSRKYIEELATFSINQAKWHSAEAFCKKQNMDFLVLTERHLF